jgi:putative transposase
VSEAKRLRSLWDKNCRLKKLLTEAMLDNVMLKDIATKNDDACSSAGSCGAPA